MSLEDAIKRLDVSNALIDQTTSQADGMDD
jgi:hypothetical protein